jgi:hypothetical protein
MLFAHLKSFSRVLYIFMNVAEASTAKMHKILMADALRHLV